MIFTVLQIGQHLFRSQALPSLVPRPLPDFILQPWSEIKSGSGLGTRLGPPHLIHTDNTRSGRVVKNGKGLNSKAFPVIFFFPPFELSHNNTQEWKTGEKRERPQNIDHVSKRKVDTHVVGGEGLQTGFLSTFAQGGGGGKMR